MPESPSKAVITSRRRRRADITAFWLTVFASVVNAGAITTFLLFESEYAYPPGAGVVRRLLFLYVYLPFVSLPFHVLLPIRLVRLARNPRVPTRPRLLLATLTIWLLSASATAWTLYTGDYWPW